MTAQRELYWEHNKDKYKSIFDDIYAAGFHNGRHKEREALVNSKWLIIDPNKREEFEKCLEDPCKYCEHYVKEYKQGCSFGSSRCEQKQKQMFAHEIKLYFDLI